MNCTEYITKAINDSIPINTTTINGIAFITPDNLYRIEKCRIIKQIIFH
ncbi:MAG: hypothetical protein ABIW47_07280 [Ginsengibacter sp.]